MPGELFQNGSRKYLTAEERARFLAAAEHHPRAVLTFCSVLAYAGCRISEALALTAERVDLAAGTLVFESPKKRRRGVFRAVPVPPTLLRDRRTTSTASVSSRPARIAAQPPASGPGGGRPPGATSAT